LNFDEIESQLFDSEAELDYFKMVLAESTRELGEVAKAARARNSDRHFNYAEFRAKILAVGTRIQCLSRIILGKAFIRSIIRDAHTDQVSSKPN